MFEKVVESNPTTFDVVFSKANMTIKRKACLEYLRLWALAAIQGSRKDSEDDVDHLHSFKQQRLDNGTAESLPESQAAVAA